MSNKGYVKLAITEDAKQTLKAAGIEVNAKYVLFKLQSASSREAAWLDTAQEEGGIMQTDPIGFFADLICRRSIEPVSKEVAREVARDIPTQELSMLVHAFVHGIWEKKVAELARKTITGTVTSTLDSLLSVK